MKVYGVGPASEVRAFLRAYVDCQRTYVSDCYLIGAGVAGFAECGVLHNSLAACNLEYQTALNALKAVFPNVRTYLDGSERPLCPQLSQVSIGPLTIVEPSAGRPSRWRMVIEAKDSFGTGHHPATHACLRVLARLRKTGLGRRVLDFGCGSGILGVFVARCQKSSVTFLDRNPLALRDAAANARRNGVYDFRSFRRKEDLLHRCARYDVVIANLSFPDHIAVHKELRASMALGGILILGGFSQAQTSSIQRLYGRNKARPAVIETAAQWAALALR